MLLVFAVIITWALATATSPLFEHLDTGDPGRRRCLQIGATCSDVEPFHLDDSKADADHTSDIVQRGSDYAMKVDERHGLLHEDELPRQHDAKLNGKLKDKDIEGSSYEFLERRAHGDDDSADKDEDQHKTTTRRGDYYDKDEHDQRHRPYDSYYPYYPHPYSPNGYPYYSFPNSRAYPGYHYYPPSAYSRPYIPNPPPAFPVGTGATARAGTNTGTAAGSGVGTGFGGGSTPPGQFTPRCTPRAVIYGEAVVTIPCANPS